MNLSIQPRLFLKSPFAITLTGCVLLFLLGLLLFRHALSSKAQNEIKLEKQAQEVQRLVSTSPIPLTQTHVAKFSRQFDDVKRKYDDLLLLLDTARVPPLNLSPLEFKEDLLKTQQLLVERANLWNIRIPHALGFSEFEGGNIPQPKEVPLLTLQFDAIKTLVNFLIESRVSSIEQMTRKESPEITLASNRVMYQMLSFEIAVQGSLSSLRAFLQKIYASSYLFIVRKIDMESQKNGGLSILIQIDAIRLRRRQES